MSIQGLSATVLWTQIAEALRKDGYEEMCDVAGTETTKVIRGIVGDLFAETPPAVSDITRQLIERDQHGRQKYGVTLDRTDLSLADWLQHMAEELMDGAGYALAAKRELSKPKPVTGAYPPPRSAAGYCVQGTGVDPATGGFACIRIDGVVFDAQVVAGRMMRHGPIVVSREQVEDWRKQWMENNPVEDGRDHVTPFDFLLYGTDMTNCRVPHPASKA